MNYPENIEEKIGFEQIRSLLRAQCGFEPGREEVDALRYQSNYDVITHLLAESQEMLKIWEDASLDFPRCEMHDLRSSLSRIRIEGLFMDEDELAYLRKALDAVMRYVDFFEGLDEERFPELTGLVPEVVVANRMANAIDENREGDTADEQPVPYKEILREIDRILDKYGQLRDNASPELARIRKELTLAQGSVNRALNQILRQAQADGIIDRDVAPTLREGRLVLPVPPAYKRKLGGIVHDESATGKTVYVEPQQVVEANNRIRELEGDERRERARILQEFATWLRPYIPGLKDSQLYLGHIDFIRAKALLAKELKAIAPEVLNQPMVELRDARHPLLYLNFRKQGKEVVPLNMTLGINSTRKGDKNQNIGRILIISGPNAGGKSVCLKTVALLQYMLQCGLLVPVEETSKMGIFERLFIDIGDEQSIEDDLSTYSSHLRNMKHFVRFSNEKTLLLIDEFGGGTEPLLGGAIAEAVLEQLNNNNAFGVITTHYTNLKHFAEHHEGVINGAMLYDRGALKPLFALSIGQPGSSFALEIAKQIGLPENIIVKAKELVGDDNIQYDKNLQDIARDKRYWADKRKQVHEKEKRLNELTEKYETELSDIKQKRKEVLLKAKEEAADILQQSNRTIENTIRQIKESAADKEKTKAARQKVENLKGSLESSLAKAQGDSERKAAKTKAEPTSLEPEAHELTVGCKVRVKGQEAIGEIVQLTDKKAVIAFGNLKSQVPLKKLEYVSNRQAKKAETKSGLKNGFGLTQSSVQSQVYSNIAQSLRAKKLSFSDTLDIRGMRADDALSEVMNYIDDAIMVGATEVRILHGTGGGVLKTVIRDYLRQVSRVVAYHDGDPDKGGAGLTIVEF